MSISVTRICRYPVKGMSAEPMVRVALTPGECLPHDRRFALARAETGFDSDRFEWLPKTHFVMLMREEKLAQLQTRFDEASGDLTIERDGRLLLRARITEAAGRESIDRFFAVFLRDTMPRAPRVVDAGADTLSNASRRPNAGTYKYVSVVNLASIRALEEAMGVALDPARFRANFYIDGASAWAEFGWVDSQLAFGGARLHVVSRTERCAATEVNPSTAVRDARVPAALRKAFGHADLGVYAEVTGGGEVALGDSVLPD